MSNDILRLLRRRVPGAEWRQDGDTYWTDGWHVRHDAGTVWVRRDLPGHGYILLTGAVWDIDGMMARAERMAWWDAMEAE